MFENDIWPRKPIYLEYVFWFVAYFHQTSRSKESSIAVCSCISAWSAHRDFVLMSKCESYGFGQPLTSHWLSLLAELFRAFLKHFKNIIFHFKAKYFCSWLSSLLDSLWATFINFLYQMWIILKIDPRNLSFKLI